MNLLVYIFGLNNENLENMLFYFIQENNLKSYYIFNQIAIYMIL